VDALPDGAVCVADVQVSGKGACACAAASNNNTLTRSLGCFLVARAGRGGNVWTSPPGCLMFSFNTRCALACFARRLRRLALLPCCAHMLSSLAA
jgi:biotin-(acetyl-CoA carboxylase) ligase